MVAKKRTRSRGIKSVVPVVRESVIENVGGDLPIGVCAVRGCLGEAARAVIRFSAYDTDLTYSRLPYVATPRAIAICRGCFEQGAS